LILIQKDVYLWYQIKRTMELRDTKKVIKDFTDKLDSLSISDYKIVNSVTDFGKSSYVYVSGLKIRCSDHGCGVRRVLSEVHLFEGNINDVVERVERINYPDRFKKVTTLQLGDSHLFPVDRLNTIKCDVEVLKDNAFITKKGRVMAKIRKRNVEITSFERI